MNLEEIKAIVELMSKHNLSEFKVEAENMHLCLKRESGLVAPMHMPSSIQMPVAPIMSNVGAGTPIVAGPQQETKASDAKKGNQVTIDSPIVGTFYRSPSPEAEPFVKIGDKVEATTIVCIIEAMKVMNEVRAEKSGIIKEILVENAQSVEYGCPLFVIE